MTKDEELVLFYLRDNARVLRELMPKTTAAMTDEELVALALVLRDDVVKITESAGIGIGEANRALSRDGTFDYIEQHLRSFDDYR